MYANTTASAKSDTKERMPLHASPTSSVACGRKMTFPSRYTGKFIICNDDVDRRAAKSCKGKVRAFRIIAGQGIMNSKNTIGNAIPLRYRHPPWYNTKPAISTTSDTRMRNNSAPTCPSKSMVMPSSMTRKPTGLGCTGSWARACRRSQRKYPLNTGIKKPCE